jgi:heat shock protein HtpX
MSTSVAAPLLVYDRIEQNRRRTVLLVSAAILLIIPFVLGFSFAVAEGITWQVSRQAHLNRFHELRMQRLDRQSDDLANHRRSTRDVKNSRDSDLQADLKAASEYTPDEKSMRLEILSVFALGLTAVLGLLVWGFASSPVSKLLAMVGARPAANEERDAQHTLETLAAGAGLPVPGLYVIESTSLNAFAAGMDPEHSVIAVTHGLLALLDARELEGVLAHELSHIGNRDTRLNVIAASFALFLRMPYLMRQRSRQGRPLANPFFGRPRLGYSLLLIPVHIYLYLIAPLLAAIMRSAISRNREFLADADAARLTRYPEGLMRALAKIAGAGSAVVASNPAVSHLYFADPTAPGVASGLLRGSLFATHPSIEDRVERLVEFGASSDELEAAVMAGRNFAHDHPPLPLHESAPANSGDELALITSGNPMGRVFRVLGDDATPLYDRDSTTSMVLTRVKKGDLLVVFDDPGKMRQVITADQTFGYLPFSVKLQRIDMMPAEIHNAEARERAIAASEPKNLPAVTVPAPVAVTRFGLTPQQLAVCAGFGVVVFAGLLVALLEFGGK